MTCLRVERTLMLPSSSSSWLMATAVWDALCGSITVMSSSVRRWWCPQRALLIRVGARSSFEPRHGEPGRDALRSVANRQHRRQALSERARPRPQTLRTSRRAHWDHQSGTYGRGPSDSTTGLWDGRLVLIRLATSAPGSGATATAPRARPDAPERMTICSGTTKCRLSVIALQPQIEPSQHDILTQVQPQTPTDDEHTDTQPKVYLNSARAGK